MCCGKCKKVKKESEMSKSVPSRCKSCVAEYAANHRLEIGQTKSIRPKPFLLSNGLKRCKKCKEEKDASKFSKRSKSTDGLTARCKSCAYLKSAIRAKKNLSFDGEKKQCSSCEQMFPLPFFYRIAGGSGSVGSLCIDCQSDKSYFYKVKKTYGISRAEYDVILQNQNGKCPCGAGPNSKTNQPHKRLHVDHDHKTGKVRGLLCRRCNVVLGFFEDDTEVMRLTSDILSDYLKVLS